MRRLTLSILEPYWIKVSSFLVIIFFILLSDAVLSDFVPGYIQGVVGSPILMGFIMAFSSLVGIVVDIVFPQTLKGVGVRWLAIAAMGGSLVFLLSLYFSIIMWPVLLILVGMGAWGVYYELDSFLTKQFVADTAPAHARGAVWGVVGVFRNLAYFLGPLVGAKAVAGGDRQVLIFAGIVLFLAYLMFLLIKLPRGGEIAEQVHGVNIRQELAHWLTLGKRVWPVLVISVLLGTIDAIFWTTGTVVNDSLAKLHPWGGWFLSVYMLPSLFVGFVIAKWGIYQGKKKWAEIFTLLGGVTLIFIGASDNVLFILGVVLIASLFLGMAWPLVDATYSDYGVRMKRGIKHIIGMSSSTMSLAYIVGPIAGGVLAQEFGEIQSFVFVGALVAVIAGLLLMVTPKKIKLPQEEIKTWDRVQ